MENVTWPPIGGSPYTVPDAGEEGWPELTDYLVALAGAQSTGAQKIAARIATTTPITVGSASDCLIAVKLVATTAATVNLPAGVLGQYFAIVDDKGDAATHNITIVPNGSDTIQGLANYVLTQNGAAVVMAFIGGGNWVITAQAAGEGGGGGVSRSALDAGAPGYVVINDDTTGLMSEEHYLAAKRGGLAINASAFTGFLKATAGVFSASAITAAELPTGIDPLKIGGGTVDSAEFGFLDGVTSSIQTQITSKVTANAGIAPATGTKVTYDAKGLVTSSTTLAAGDIPSGIVATKIGAGLVDDTEFGMLNNITGNIQSQLDSRVVGPGVAVDSQYVVFDGTTGKLVKAASGTGIAYSTAGTASVKTFDQITPTQTANGGKYLTTDGTNSSWATVSAGGYSASVITANPAPAVVNTQYLANTTSGAFTITLPAGTTGAKIKIQDDRGTWDTNNLTITPATGEKIWPLAINTSLVCNVLRGWIELVYDGTGWSPNSLASTTLGSGGGLVGQSATTTTSAVNGVMYECDTTSAAFTLTLPGGTSAAIVGILDSGPFFTTNNLIVAPATGQFIDTGAANDTITFNANRANCIFYRANGSSTWEIQTSSLTATAPGFNPGYLGGSAIGASYVGQTLTNTFTATAAGSSGSQFNIGSAYVLPAGVWIVHAAFYFAPGTATSNTYVGADISTTSATLRANSYVSQASTPTLGSTGGATLPLPVNSSGTTNIYAVGIYNFAAVGTSQILMNMVAVRIA